MNVLVACEESQAVTIELRKLGHTAFSCDIQECSGGHPEWHIVGDMRPLLNGDCEFEVSTGKRYALSGRRWDMIIGFPPCTDIAVSGSRHFEKKRADGRQEFGLSLFASIYNADCDKIAIENPVNIVGGEYVKKYYPQYTYLPKSTQRIQPYEYGHPQEKTTCLWLKNLPALTPTNIVTPEPRFEYNNGTGKSFPAWMMNKSGKERSKTFQGIAQAMAEQWTRG